MIDVHPHPASYKDPAGFVFNYEGKIYRQVNKSYAAEYDLLMQSGLYINLTNNKWLLPHTEVATNITSSVTYYKTLLPEQIPFISYSYEWSFDMLKDAALLTLKINQAAIEHGMILKDATPFNIQFHKGTPVFIDTLSFEKYDAGKPWVAYRQFCETFLFPLYLEYYLKTDIKKILSNFIDGIPVAVIAKLLPLKSRFNLGVWLHVYLQYSVKTNKAAGVKKIHFDKTRMTRLLQHLKSIIESFKTTHASPTTWDDYYDNSILSKTYLESKEKIFRSFIQDINFTTALDLGANDGYFSNILAETKTAVTAVDFDSICINRLYNQAKHKKINNILPLSVDISNPSPATGFCNTERASFLQRSPSDLVIALALIHHLVFTKNIPLELLPGLFAQLALKYLIIEFVPIEDEKVKLLLQGKTGYHTNYSQEVFESLFLTDFKLVRKETVPGSSRIVYLMQKK